MHREAFPDLKVFDALPVSFWMSHGKKGEYRIAAWNQGAATIYGFSADEALGKSYIELFVDPDPKVAQQSKKDADAVISGNYKHPVNCLAIDRNKHGQEIILLTNVFRYEYDGVGYQAEIGVNLTPSGFLNFIDEEFKNKRTGPEHETQRTLEALLKHAQAQFEVRRGKWIRTFTHEIRSHLSVIRNALAELEAADPGILARPLYGDIAHSTRQLQLQSDNFLLSEKRVLVGTGAGAETLPSLFGEAIDQVAHEYEYAAATRNIRIQSLPIKESVSLIHLKGTRDAFIHSLRNIVSNAVQHSPDDKTNAERVVKISTTRSGRFVLVVVENIGHLGNDTDTPHLGLEIIDAWTSGVGGSFDLKEEPRGHVTAMLRWPVPR